MRFTRTIVALTVLFLSATFGVNIFAETQVPIGHWNFNDGSGTVAADSSGNNYDGIVESGTWVDGALDFNGSTTRVTIPSSAFAAISDEITIAMWVYGADSQPREDTILYAVNGSGQRMLNIHLPWSNSTVYFDAGFNGTYDRIYNAADAASFKGQWNHWVFTKNANTGVMAMYVNGMLHYSETGKTASMTGITSAMVGSDVTDRYYDGAIDDVQLYPVALTAQEVADLYTAPVSWTELTRDDFEDGWGNWLDGGDDARRALINANGLRCLALQDNTASSEAELSNSLDLTGYTDLKIDFSYVVQSFEAVEDFWVRYSSDGGSSWTTLQAFVNDVDFVDDGTRYFPSVTINSGSYTFNNNVKIKIECDASGDADDVYIDDVVISALYNPVVENPVILNASFELDETTSAQEQVTQLSGWDVTQGNVDLISSEVFAAAEGNYVIDLNGNQPGAISQMVSGLIPDHEYTLRVAYADRKGRKNPTIATAEIWVNGALLTILRNTSDAPDYIDGIGFLVQSTQAGELQIEFRSNMTGADGLIIDHIRLVEGNLIVYPESPGIANPSFEAAIDPADDPSDNPHLFGYQLPGWLVLRENIDLIRIAEFGVPDGESAADLGGHGAGGIGQIITDLEPGARYAFSMMYARHLYWDAGGVLTAEVYFNGELAMSLARDLTQKVPQWERVTTEFIAPADGRLKLEMYSTAYLVGGGILFDDLSLEKIAE